VTRTVYLLAAQIRPNEAAWVEEQTALGKFVLATNDLNLSVENLGCLRSVWAGLQRVLCVRVGCSWICGG